MPPHLIIMDKVVLFGVIFLKWSVSDHKKEMKANYLSFCEYLTKIPSPDFLSQGHKVQLPVIIKYLMKIKILWTYTPPLCV